MKLKDWLCIVALVGAIGLLGCKPSESTISGQVFIVTKGAENIKLGAVQILLVEKQQVTDFLRERQTAIDGELRDRRKALEDALGAIKTANSNALTAKLNYDAALARVPASAEYVRSNKQIENLRRKGDVLKQTWDLLMRRIKDAQPGSADFDNYEGLLKQQDAVEKQIDSINNAIDAQKNKLEELERLAEAEESPKVAVAQDAATSAESNVADLRLSLSNFPTTGAYLAGFSPFVAKKTLTDADGRFSISYQRGKAFTLYAMAQRQVAQSTENYCWLVNAPTNAAEVQLFLSNGNLTTVDPDGYFELKPQETGGPMENP